MRLEERVLFDAAAAAAAVEADNQAQQNEELQQQQQQLQEQIAAEEAARQAEAQAAAQAEAAAQESEAETAEADAAAAGAETAQENVNAGSEVSAAVEAIAADEGVEVEADGEESEKTAEDVVGEALEGLNGVEVEANAETEEVEIPVAENTETEETEVLALTPEEIAASIANGTRHELVIVSDSVKDAKVIIDGLAEGTEVLVLDRESDVLDQINEYLDNSTVKYDAIHVVSHGGDGYLVLNNSVIDMESLQADPASWAAIGEHVAEDGDIMLYGCNVAQTENGKAFASQLASLTGADIAASIDSTGGTYGWELEYVTNAVATPVLSFNGYNARLASLTLVENGSGEDRDWNVNLHAAGTYYGFATGTTLTNSDGTTVNSASGQLYYVTVTEKAGEGGAPATYEYKYTVESDKGNIQYVLAQAEASEGADSIAILKDNVVGSVDLGNVSSAVNGGGLTINGASQIDITLSVSGTLNGSLSVDTAQSVSVSGTVNLGEGGSLSISNVTAATGTAVSTGAITLGEGASASFSNISVEGTGTAVNIGGAINGGNEGTSVTFSDISSEAGKAVNVTGAINAETVSFTNISTEAGSHAIDLNGLTAKNVTLLNVEGNIDFGGLTINEGEFNAAANGSQVNFGNVAVNEASFTFNGAVDDLRFGSVAVNSGSFNVINALAAEENIAADVTFTGAVTVTDSTFTVAVSGNSGFAGDVMPEGSVRFNSTFTASAVKGATSVSITVQDVGEGPEYTQDDRILGNAAGTTESRIIFNGNVTLGGEGSKSSVSANLSAVYIGFNGNVAVGAGKGATTLTVSDFGQVKLNANSTFSIGTSGPDAKNNDTVTFTAIDRDGFNDEHKVGYFGDKYRVEVGNLDIGRDAKLVINNLMMDVRGTTVTHYGDISGADSELTFRNTVTQLNGVGFLGGEVHLDSVRYENGLQTVDGGSIYRGHYGNLGLYLAGNANSARNYTIAVNLFELVDIDNVTFINRNDDAANFTGSFANVTMSGRFSEFTDVTMDFEVGSKVNVLYNSPSQQYVLGGNYYELTVNSTAEKILAGSITVGVSAPQLKTLQKDIYDTNNATDLKILARKMEHLYRGGISLGTTLKTQGNTVDFYGYTYAATDKALIDTAGSTALSNRVSYHVAHNLVNIPGLAWGMGIGLNGVAHENGGVGPNGAAGNVRDDEAYKAFFGGTYQNLTIDTMPSLPEFSGVELLGQDEVTFNVDVDATVNGGFMVQSLKEDNKTEHHHLQVNVDSTMTFNDAALKVTDASVHFNGGVFGNISVIDARRDNTFGNSGLLETAAQESEFIGELRVTFDSKLNEIDSIVTDGIALLFNNDVAQVGSIDVYGSQSNADHAKITFNGDVSVQQHIKTHTEYDLAKPVLYFNGETTGSAEVDSYRGEFYFNYDGDQEIFEGVYDDFSISGTGEKVVRGDTVIKGVFNGNETAITISEDKRFEISTLYGHVNAADPHTPVFTVESGATLQFGNANTLGMDFYGSIISSGNIEIFGKGNFYGTITLDNTGNMIVDEGADGSRFVELINRGTGLTIEREITIDELHNYGTMTVTNNNVSLDVYNHKDANIKFDFKYGTAVGGVFSFDFDRGEASGAGIGNRLINGGTITVTNGTLNLNSFTQGDKNADTGKWTYGGENFIVGQRGTLNLNTTFAEVNDGNDGVPASFLGDIDNAGTFRIGNIGNAVFSGDITNDANSKFILANSEATFNGSFTHNGSLSTENASAIIFNSTVSGNGTIGGTAGYDGIVTYNGAEQQILTGIYNGSVTLAEGAKAVSGDIVFNNDVINNAVIAGNNGSVVFNGNTQGSGSFAGQLDVTYDTDSSAVFAGTYGDLVISGNNRTIAVNLSAANLTLSGSNTFNGADAENSAALIVNGEIVLADSSITTFGEFSSLNAGSETAAVIRGGKNGGALTVTTNAVGENVTVFAEGLNAAVTYNYNGADGQAILAGTYLSGMVLAGSAKTVSGSVSVTGALTSQASSLTVGNGKTLEVIGTVAIDMLKVDFGGTLDLSLTGASTIGTASDYVTTDDVTGAITDYSDTGVILGGKLNVSSGNGSTLTVYGWRDTGSIGTVNLNSGKIDFTGTPAQYGFVNAEINNNTGNAANVIDDNGRLQNVWVTIFDDTFTSQLTDYDSDSKFRVVNGATLTVDHFALWNDTNGNGIKEDGENWLITNAVTAFSLQDGSTLIFALEGGYFADGVDKSISVNDLHMESGSQVIINSGNTLSVVSTADIEGTVSGSGNAILDGGTYIGDGSFNMTGGQVSYGENVFIYDGVYNDVKISSNKITSNITVNGTASLDGIMTGNGKVTFNGETNGNATFGDIASDKTYTGLVTYGENAGAVYGGQYNNISIQGDHNVSASLKVNLIEGGTFKLDSTLTLKENVVLTINGLTDANAENNNGRIEGAESSSVIYGYNADIYGGVYGKLTANGTEYLLTKDVTVNGAADLKGTFLGNVNVDFNGETKGSAVFGVIGDDTKVFGGTVSYADVSQTVYGGNYYDLVVDGDHTLKVALAVNNSADINGILSGTADVTFAQGATLQGGGSFGASGADYQGTVTYNGVDYVYGGFYSGINFANGNTVSTDVAASGNVTLAGALALTADGSIAFNGTTDANTTGPRNTGVINAADGSSISYAATADVYNGTYGDLTITGDHLLLVNGEAPDGIVVNGTATLSDGILTGNTKVTFNGTTAGNSTFGDINSDTTYTGTVTYGTAAGTIFGGQYNSINIAGDASDIHTLIASLNVTVPSGGSFKLSSQLVLEDGVTLTLNGVTDANEAGNTGSISGSADSTVIYSGDAAVYGGTYGNLTFTGAGYELLNDFTVANTAQISGNITGSAAVTFNGAVSGNAVFGNLETESVYAGSVTYDNTSGGAEQTVFGGYYGTLNIIGDHILDHQLRINAGANFEGVITERSSALDVTFDANAVLTGSGQFGQDADNRYQGIVTYNGVTGDTGVFSGFYSTLKLSGTNETAAANINVDEMVLEGVLAVRGLASVELAGTTSGNGTFSATDANTLVTYADTAKLYGGSYGGLTFGSDRVLDLEMTVYGTATLNGTMTGSAKMTFYGGIAGNAEFGTAEDAPYTGEVTYAGAGSDIYGGFYNDLVITNDHTLTNAFVVVAAGQAVVNDAVLSGNAAVTLNGTTSGNGRFGVSADNRYEGTVTYNLENAHILGGFYGGTKDNPGLVINNNGTIDAGIEVVSFSTALTGTLTVEGSVFFSDWTDAVAKGDAAKVEGSGSIGYGTTADIYGGTYANLVIYGDHHFSNSITVNGTTTVYANNHGAESATAARLTGADGIDLVFKGIVTDEGAKIGLNAYFDLLNNAAPASVTYESAGDVLGGYYNLLNVNGVGTNTVQGILNAGEVVLADGVTLSGTGDWTIGKNNADSSTAVVDKDSGTVTYNGLTAGETGWIFRGEYNDLTLEGGNYQVGTVTVDGTLTSDATGKIVFTDLALGEGKAENLNADYMYNANIYGGNYNNLGVNKIVAVANDVTVKGALTALSSSALITGSADFEVAGTLAGFDNGGRFEYEGEVIFSGAADYSVDGMAQGNSFNTLTMKGSGNLTLANSEFELLAGTGNINIGAGVTGGTVNMTAGKVTYTANADRYEDGGIYYSDIIDGTYYDLTLNQNNAVVNINGNVTVSNLFDINGHELINVGDLTIVKFDNEAGLTNAGTLTFGGETAPDVRQVWEGEIVNGFTANGIDYPGEIIINRANYEFSELYNFSTVTVTEDAVATSSSDVVKMGVYSGYDSIFNLKSDVVIYDHDSKTQFTNRGTVNISGVWGKFSDFHIYNLTQSTINVTNTVSATDPALDKFTFGENVKLTNSGLVKVGEGAKVKLVEVNENLSGRPVYQTVDGGEFYFDFDSNSINVANGLLGELKNHEGTMYFLTDGMKYLGKLTNGDGTKTQGDVYIHADSTFKEAVTSTYGIIQVGNGTDEVTANFLHNVLTHSYFELLDKGEAVFESIVSVVHEFYMESGSKALFMDEVRIYSTNANEADTVFYVKQGADATFFSEVFNQNGYGFHERDGWSVSKSNSVQSVTGSFSKESDVYIDSIISSNDWACDSEYLSKFIIDGHVVINGKLSNIAYGWNSDNNQANVVVNSDNNVFNAIDNRGSAARLDMNGSNNQFNGAIFNTGNLYLNGTNDYNDIEAAHCSISFKIGSVSYSDSTINNGYVWVNDGATGSTFRKISIGGNPGREATNPTFTVVSYNNSGIDLVFTDTVNNWGRFNINSAGSVFERAVTNYNEFRIYGVAQFDDLFTNKGRVQKDVTAPGGERLVGAELSIGAAGTRFNKIVNDGVIDVDAFTIFESSITNRGILNFNVGGMTFSAVDNDGVINLHNASQTVIRNLNIGQSSVIDIDKNSSLHLHVVTEEYAGKYDNENYDYENDTKLGTIYVRGDQRNGIYENHVNVNVSDSEHGLFFEDTGNEQTIGSRIVYDTTDIESAVWFTNNTVLNYEDASWIIVRDGETLTLSVIDSTEKYKVLTGGELIVRETASGTRIQVSGGSLLFDNDGIALTITGLVEIKSGTAVFDNSQSLTFTRGVVNAGTITFNAGSKTTFNNGLVNSGTVEAFTNINGDVTNTGTYVIKGKDLIVDSSLNNANGTLSVVGSAQLKADVGGNIAVQEEGVLKVGISDITSNLTNSGTVAVGTSTVTFSGDILKGGTFSGNSASLVFTGDVKTGASGVFNGITSVEYAGTAASQNIILGTYNNLTLNGGLKVVDDGTVAVNGTFTNNNEVKITDDGELILNKAVAGTGAYSNAGTLTFGENASGTIAAVNNSGTVNADGTVNFANLNNSAKGTFNADGNIKAAGTNAGTIVVNGALSAQGLSSSGDVKVNKAGTLTLNDNEVLKGNVDNAGKVIANADDAAFGSSFKNTGTLTVNGSNAAFKGNTNEGTVTLNGSNADLNGSLNKGVVALRNDNVSIQGLNNDGTLELHTYNGMDLSQLDNRDGVIEFHVDATITDDITQGRVAVSGGRELTIKMDEVNGSYNANAGTLTFEAVAADAVSVNSDMSVSSQGTLKLNSDVVFNGDIDHDGNINTQDNDLTFEGETSGNGRVSGNLTNTVTYGLKAAHIYEGEYANLVIKGASAVGENSDVAVNGTLQNDGSIAVDGLLTLNGTLQNDGSIAVDGLLTLNGATQGSGTMAGGNGEVVYNGNADEQSIYAGSYNDLTIGKDAAGNFDIAGDISISGDALNKSSNGAELAITDGRVTYNGTDSQHVMAGTYDELVMAGSGTKLMEADVFNVNSFTANGGGFSNMLKLTSADAPAMWTLNAADSNIHYSFVDYADSTSMIFLDGTNMIGSGNSGSWAVFNSAGGVGDMYPSLYNPNFQAIAPYMSTLTLEWGSTGRFDIFRRMPVSMAAIAAGDMSDLVTLNTFENYDMIDFDGEFFGNAHSIGLLDEESREVLDDAASAGNSDLKALLED